MDHAHVLYVFLVRVPKCGMWPYMLAHMHIQTYDHFTEASVALWCGMIVHGDQSPSCKSMKMWSHIWFMFQAL